MTSSTLRRSVKVTPKPEPKLASSGTLTETTEPESEPTSEASTTWIVTYEDGEQQSVTVPGNGRATLGGTRGHNELRIYETKASKDYALAISGGVFAVRKAGVIVGPKHGSPTASTATTVSAGWSPPTTHLSGYDLTELAEKIVAGAMET